MSKEATHQYLVCKTAEENANQNTLNFVVFVVVVVLWLLLLFCVGVGLCAFVCVCGCGCGGVWGCVCDMFKCSVTISTQPLRNAIRYTGFQVSDVGWNARSLCTSVDWKRGECSLQTVLCSKCSKLKRNVKIRKIKILSVPYKTKGFV